MANGTIKKDSGFGIAQVILFISIAILVIFVAWPVLLILFNAFFVEGNFNSMDFYKVLTEPETFQALINSLIIAPAADVIATSSAAVMAALLELIMPVLPSMLMEPVVEVTELPSFTLSVPFTDCSVTSPTVSMAAKLVPIVIFLPLIKVRLFSLCIFIVL